MPASYYFIALYKLLYLFLFVAYPLVGDLTM